MPPATEYLGRLVGNTGRPNDLRAALRGSFSARRGEFVRIPHREREGEPEADCLGRITGVSRNNVLFSQNSEKASARSMSYRAPLPAGRRSTARSN